MDNSFFILSKSDIEVSRFHICTWDVETENSFVEIGIEFNCPNSISEIDFKFIVPFIQKTDTVRCLASDLIKDTDNSKFIFNDNIKNYSSINNDKRNGGILNFETRGSMYILPLERKTIEVAEQIISFKIKNVQHEVEQPCYVRFLINSTKKTLALEKRGITKTSYIYDLKLNEKRNLPDRVHNIIKDEYCLCAVKQCFCFHVVPNSLSIDFVDQTKLKNIRELEVDAFKKYLPELQSMKAGRYMIIFNKDKNSEAYSFFTIFTKETIGAKQILFAVGANIFCSLLFAISTLRNSLEKESNVLKQVPIEFWIAILILFILILSLFHPLRRVQQLFKI